MYTQYIKCKYYFSLSLQNFEGHSELNSYSNIFKYIYISSIYREEVSEFIEIGVLNAFFILGRSIGFIGSLLLDNILYS